MQPTNACNVFARASDTRPCLARAFLQGYMGWSVAVWATTHLRKIADRFLAMSLLHWGNTAWAAAMAARVSAAFMLGIVARTFPVAGLCTCSNGSGA